MTCNHQLRVLGNPDDGRGDRETKQRLKGREERKQTNNNNKQKKKRMVILLHTQAITETKSCLGEGRGGEGGREGGGGEIRGRQKKKKKRGGSPRKPRKQNL